MVNLVKRSVRRTPSEKLMLLALSVLFAAILTFGLPRNVLFLSFYIVPIILAANYYGLIGGLMCAAFSALLASLAVRQSGTPLEESEVLAQIILYFLVGGFAGFMQKENLRVQRSLHLSSITDELTGLYNYQHFRRRFSEEVARARRYGHPLALIMCDVNHFKQYNDAFGHPNGNFALNKIGAIIKDAIRESDIPFRYGGDEFAVILPETGKDAEEVARRIVEGVHRGFAAENMEEELRPSLSAGVTFTRASNQLSTATIMPFADSALYEAKRSPDQVSVLPAEGRPQNAARLR